MKNLNTRSAISLIAIVAGVLAISSSACASIMSGEERSEKLDSIRAILDHEVVAVEADLLGAAPDPFQPNHGLVEREEITAVASGNLSDEELLAKLVEYIKPTGTFAFGGEYYLVFKEKKVKTGSEIGVVYNGTEYKVLISDVTGSTYTASYGDSELQLKLK